MTERRSPKKASLGKSHFQKLRGDETVNLFSVGLDDRELGQLKKGQSLLMRAS